MQLVLLDHPVFTHRRTSRPDSPGYLRARCAQCLVLVLFIASSLDRISNFETRHTSREGLLLSPSNHDLYHRTTGKHIHRQYIMDFNDSNVQRRSP
jgi:hypothetical protein